jgi:hypothetical protein
MTVQRKMTLQGRVLEAILKPMEEAEKRRLDRTLEVLNQKNRELLKAPSDGFLYGGQFHLPAGNTVTLPAMGKRSSLDHSLWEDAEAYMADIKTTKDDLQFIRQILFKLLSPCTCFQDIRDTLPDFLVDTLPETKALPRIQKEAFTIQHDARALRQFEQLKEKLALYRAGRLMY